MILTLLIFIPLCNSLPLSVGWTYWLASPIRFQKTDFCLPSILSSPLLAHSYLLTSALWWSQLPCHEGDMGKPTWQGIKGGLGPTASEELRLPVPQSLRNWVLRTTTEVVWGVDSSTVEPSDDTAALANAFSAASLETQRQLSRGQTPDLQKLR